MEANSKTVDVEDLEHTLKNSDSYVKDMLKFFEEGWDARGVDDKAKFEARIKANVVTTLTYTNEVIQQFFKLNLHPQSVHIKLENPNSQSVLFAVPKDDFMKKDLLKIYSFTHKIEKSSRSDDYRVAFSVTYDDGTLDEDCLQSEGYIRTHNIN